MIRAIFRDGQIQPLDPLPTGWDEGQELQITEIEPSDDPEAIERWCRDLDSIADRPDDPIEWKNFNSALAEADHHVTSQVSGVSQTLDVERTDQDNGFVFILESQQKAINGASRAVSPGT